MRSERPIYRSCHPEGFRELIFEQFNPRIDRQRLHPMVGTDRLADTHHSGEIEGNRFAAAGPSGHDGARVVSWYG